MPFSTLVLTLNTHQLKKEYDPMLLGPFPEKKILALTLEQVQSPESARLCFIDAGRRAKTRSGKVPAEGQ